MSPYVFQRWREARQWSLEDAAAYLGTTKTSVHRWEKGIHPIPQTIAILAELLTEATNIRRVQKMLRSPLD
jgi:transcriptional regulator with XRE-family HTH domain